MHQGSNSYCSLAQAMDGQIMSCPAIPLARANQLPLLRSFLLVTSGTRIFKVDEQPTCEFLNAAKSEKSTCSDWMWDLYTGISSTAAIPQHSSQMQSQWLYDPLHSYSNALCLKPGTCLLRVLVYISIQISFFNNTIVQSSE